jgi:hypothetical protein
MLHSSFEHHKLEEMIEHSNNADIIAVLTKYVKDIKNVREIMM